MHEQARDAVDYLRQQDELPCLVAQNLVEFRAVCTRPANVNGLGMTQSQADDEIARLKALFHVYDDEPDIRAEWERLVSVYGAEGKQNHDARLAACMIIHGIPKNLTFNRDDFVRYQEIAVLTPQEVLSAR
jgi:hypothetical protein